MGADLRYDHCAYGWMFPAAASSAAATRCAGGRGLDAIELVRVGGARAERLDDLGLAHAAVAQHHDHVSPRAGRGGRLHRQAVVHLLGSGWGLGLGLGLGQLTYPYPYP